MLIQCWATVNDAGPTVNQHWFNVSCLLGHLYVNVSCLLSSHIHTCYQLLSVIRLCRIHADPEWGLHNLCVTPPSV